MNRLDRQSFLGQNSDNLLYECTVGLPHKEIGRNALPHNASCTGNRCLRRLRHPGKFALAFRERMHISPSAYRKTKGT